MVKTIKVVSLLGKANTKFDATKFKILWMLDEVKDGKLAIELSILSGVPYGSTTVSLLRYYRMGYVGRKYSPEGYVYHLRAKGKRFLNTAEAFLNANRLRGEILAWQNYSLNVLEKMWLDNYPAWQIARMISKLASQRINDYRSGVS